MTHVPRELYDEFPEFRETIHQLKQEDEHFLKLAQQYHDLTREIEQVDSGVAPASDRADEDLHKERVRLKDEIADYLRQHSQP